MGRRSLGPRLYLQPERLDENGKRLEKAAWVIRDGTIKRSTGFGEGEHAQAELAFRDYLEGKAPERTFYVYFISARHEGFPIKIGITENRSSRFASIQNALPFDVDVLALIPVQDPIAERRLHRQFASCRLKGEWFSRTPELMTAIDRLRDETGGA